MMMSGQVQVWPGTPVAETLIENGRVAGVRLSDQGVDKAGNPTENYLPGMDVKAPLTVVADGPVGPLGRQLDRHFGMPEGHSAHEWALGMKVVLDLPENTQSQARFRSSYHGLSRTRDFRFPLRLPGQHRRRGHLRALLVRQPRPHGLPLPSALDAPSRPLETPGRGHPAQPGAPRASRNRA